MKRPRQYIVTHLATGQQTVVLSTEVLTKRGWHPEPESAARKAGCDYPRDCAVNIVKRGREYRLPFDEIPLVIKRGSAQEAVAAAA